MRNIREAIDAVHQKVVYPYLMRGEAKKNREEAHRRAIRYMSGMLEWNSPLRAVMDRFFTYRDPVLETELHGYKYRNPLGLAAGFDKDGKAFLTMLSTGLGFVEIGSINLRPYEGNKEPRIFGLEEDDGLINRMGFPGDGTGEVVPRVVKKARDPKKTDQQLWVNHSASAPSFRDGTEIEDFHQAFVDTLAIPSAKRARNESSPNTPGVVTIQDPEPTARILDKDAGYLAKNNLTASLAIKFSPDRTPKQVEETLVVVAKYPFVDTIILGNSTVDPAVRATLYGSNRLEIGGISGPPVRAKSLAQLDALYPNFKDRFAFVQVGGLGTGYDLVESIAHGATLGECLSVLVNRRTSTPNRAYYINQTAARIVRYDLKMDNIQDVRGNTYALRWVSR